MPSVLMDTSYSSEDDLTSPKVGGKNYIGEDKATMYAFYAGTLPIYPY